jgi:hypothetical protein
MSPSQLPAYYIAEGVRRAVAAREAGLADILAIIVAPGKRDRLERIPLDQLRSPKDLIYRDGRYLRVEIATKAGKAITPIEVQPFGLPGQLPAVELRQVQLL